jgi:hypothetical protein
MGRERIVDKETRLALQRLGQESNFQSLIVIRDEYVKKLIDRSMNTIDRHESLTLLDMAKGVRDFFVWIDNITREGK